METEYINRKTKLVEYIKLHVISLEQDIENISEEMEALDPASKDYNELDFEYNHMSGQILSARYLLKTMEEML